MSQRESFNEKKNWEDREEGNTSKQAQGPGKQNREEPGYSERKSDKGQMGGKQGPEKRADQGRKGGQQQQQQQQKGQQPRQNFEKE